jgi:Sugar kinases, ribokinase family
MTPTAAVIGTIFMDCKGFAKQKYNPAGRNLGSVKFVHGGVGRNVAENLANLGIQTSFVTSVDRSAIGRETIARLAKSGVGTEFIIEADNRGMGLWLAVMDDTGDLAGSISQMPDLFHLENFISENGADIIRQAGHIILELDLNEHITRKVISLARENHRPVYGIPGNLSVVMNNMDILGDLECFICNHVEAERLLGVHLPISDTAVIERELARFVAGSGLGSMVITLGSAGCVFYGVHGGAGYQPVFPVTVIDTSGAGDAFFSGTIMGLTRGLPLKNAVVCGTKVASWTIQSNENTCRDLAAKAAADPVIQEILVG